MITFFGGGLHSWGASPGFFNIYENVDFRASCVGVGCIHTGLAKMFETPVYFGKLMFLFAVKF